MNRILLRADEVDSAGLARLGGRRAAHILEVLSGRKGSEVRAGILDGPRGTARIEAVGPGEASLRCALHDAPPPRPAVDLMLALPRPKVMKRLWAVLASLGVDRVVLTNAAKVERCYFDTHWLDPVHYEPLLVEGLEQSGDTRMPRVLVRNRLKPFVEDELDGMFPEGARLVGHPAGAPAFAAGAPAPAAPSRVLVAVGPEGGWTEPELRMLAARRFMPVSLGWRTLRTDTACVALLAYAHALAGDAHNG